MPVGEHQLVDQQVGKFLLPRAAKPADRAAQGLPGLIDRERGAEQPQPLGLGLEAPQIIGTAQQADGRAKVAIVGQQRCQPDEVFGPPVALVAAILDRVSLLVELAALAQQADQLAASRLPRSAGRAGVGGPRCRRRSPGSACRIVRGGVGPGRRSAAGRRASPASVRDFARSPKCS